VEWCKAFSRTKRFEEEVRLGKEEMRRTLAYGETARREWERLAGEELLGASAELAEGQRVYAAEHAATERAGCADLEARWCGILAQADAYLVDTSGRSFSDVVILEVDISDELDPEEEEARLEGDKEDGPL
jgi:hypothetical protein